MTVSFGAQGRRILPPHWRFSFWLESSFWREHEWLRLIYLRIGPFYYQYLDFTDTRCGSYWREHGYGILRGDAR